MRGVSGGGGTVGGFSRVAFLKITMNVRLVRETCALVATCRHFILFVCRVFCGIVAAVVVVVVLLLLMLPLLLLAA